MVVHMGWLAGSNKAVRIAMKMSNAHWIYACKDTKFQYKLSFMEWKTCESEQVCSFLYDRKITAGVS
jgi:hypothetical protein